MIWLFIAVLLGFWLFPWLIIVILQAQSFPLPLREISSNLRFEARWRRPVFLYFLKDPSIGIIGFRKNKKFFIYVSRPLWEKLDEVQQEAIILWLGFIDHYSSLSERLFWKSLIRSADRETVLALPNGTIWMKTLEIIYEYHRAFSTSSFWAGLGPLGPSLLSTYPSLEERQFSIARYLADR